MGLQDALRWSQVAVNSFDGTADLVEAGISRIADPFFRVIFALDRL
jgi:hypothetical protein